MVVPTSTMVFNVPGGVLVQSLKDVELSRLECLARRFKTAESFPKTLPSDENVFSCVTEY